MQDTVSFDCFAQRTKLFSNEPLSKGKDVCCSLIWKLFPEVEHRWGDKYRITVSRIKTPKSRKFNFFQTKAFKEIHWGRTPGEAGNLLYLLLQRRIAETFTEKDVERVVIRWVSFEKI